MLAFERGLAAIALNVQRRRRTEKDDLFPTPKKGFWKLWSDERAIAWYRRKIGEDL